MTDSRAKAVSLALVAQWESRRVWTVKLANSDRIRWFKSETNARVFALSCPDATIEETITSCEPTTFHFDDEMFMLQRQLVGILRELGM